MNRCFSFLATRQVVLALILTTYMINAGLAQDSEEGFKPIFNGKDLAGWDGDPKLWSVKDGAITGQTTQENPATKNTFLIWRQGEVDDFELRLSFRIVNGNSGIQYRSHETGQWEVGGYQADIETGPQWMGALYDEQGRGPLAKRGEKTVIDEKGEKKSEQVGNADELLAAVKKEDWNTYTIIAQGNRLIQKINGNTTAEVTDNDPKGYRAGILALQIHAGPPMTIQFKDICLKRLPMQDKKKVVMMAGAASHGYDTHEHNAGCILLKQCLDQLPDTFTTVYQDGWPADPTAFDNADTILIFCDGGAGNPMIQDNRLQVLEERMKKGVGLLVLHYAVEVPKDRGGAELLNWIGGYYERPFSINPTWTADFKEIPKHPITNGLKPFTIQDEWYFNMRFRPEMKGVTPLLVATPPDAVREGDSAKYPGRPEIVAWCAERTGGGRGFGFTGGHFHNSWGDDNFRTLILNAIYWTSHLEIPENGVSSHIDLEFLKKNLDNDRHQKE